MKVKGFKKFTAIFLSLLLIGMLMPVMHVKADGDVEINETNFPDEKFRTFISQYDTVPYGVLTQTEISNVTSMNCSSNNISDLTGIGYFTALETLDCSYNNLTSLDLSKNTDLKELDCHFNELTTLDVTKNKALTKLDCHSIENHNKLTSLKLPLLGEGDTPVLEELNCSSNQLTELNVQKHTVLKTLDCHDNKLTSLDVSANTALTTLECYGNQLTSLDLSKNTDLTTLKCYKNQLTSLDLSKNTALTTLECYGNQLTSLDLSKNTALTTLKCYNNKLTSLDLSKNTALTTLECSNNKLDSLDVSNNKVLKSITCNSNPFTSLKVSFDDGAEIVTVSNGGHGTFDAVIKYKDTEQQIPDNTITIKNPTPTITGYDFTGWDFAAGGGATQENKTTATIFTVGSANSTITALWKVDINATNFPDENFRNYILSNSYGADRILTSTEIADVNIITCYAQNISSLKGIEFFTALTDLHCYSNQLTSLDVSNNVALTDLHCYSNQLTSLDVSNNAALTNLCCFSNPLTSLIVPIDSGSTIATVSNGGHGKFDCTGINISNKTLTIADPVATDSAHTFKEWNFTGADKTPVTGGTKFTVTSASPTITATWSVLINETTFPDANFRSFIKSQSYGADGILTPDEIASVTLMDCHEKEISTLKGIEFFTALTVLDCSDNRLTSLDLSSNTKIKNLYCNYNSLTALDVSHNTALESLACASNQLTSLDVSKNIALTYLGCPYNNLTFLNVSGTALVDLYCDSNQLTSLDVSNNTALKNFNCSSNPLNTLVVPLNSTGLIATVYGGQGTFNCTEIDISKKTLTIADPTPSTTAYTFNEWEITGAGTTKETVTGGTKFTVGSESPTITATYKKKSSGGGGGYVPPTYKVTYTDGVEDTVFEDETYTVSSGSKTPGFKGKTEREGYTFKGWSPEVSERVTKSVTYTAVWEEDEPIKPDPEDPDPEDPDPEKPDPLKPVPVKIYRLYNPGGYHFFTSDIDERDFLVSLGWDDEGTGFISAEIAAIPVYRVYNPNNGDHFFTVSLDEMEQLVSFGWSFEGIGFYSFDEGVPVYRLYDPNSGEHFYTTDSAERDILLGLGWSDEGIGFYMTEETGENGKIKKGVLE